MAPAPDPLRRALELAFAVAREEPAPPAVLRPLVRFSRLTPVVLDAVRRAVDGDEEFRSRVALEADLELVGRAGQLWLTRPEGWQDELAPLLEPPPAEVGEADGAPPRQGRRAAREDAARARRDEDLRRARHERDELAARLDEERRARAGAERALVQAVADRNELSEERAEAVRLLKAAEARAAAVATERNELRRRLRDVPEPGPAGPPPARAVDGGAPDAGPAGPVRGAPGPGEPVTGAPVAGDPVTADPVIGDPVTADPVIGDPVTADPVVGAVDALDRRRAAPALERAAAAAAELGAALRELAALLAPGPAPTPAPVREPPSAAPVTAAASPSPSPSPSPAPAVAAGPVTVGGAPARVPVDLPGGVLDDSEDAAEHLLRVPGAVCLVDGYNLTKSAWPDLPPAEQRARLVQALGTLAARTGIELDVVFDGADVGPVAPLLSPRGVRVRYSPASVEADDVILGLVQDYPSRRPVVVASSDNRVREGARRGGANLLHADQMLAALRR